MNYTVKKVPEGYETVEEVAARWGVTPGTVRTYASKESISSIKVGGRLFFKKGLKKPYEERKEREAAMYTEIKESQDYETVEEIAARWGVSTGHAFSLLRHRGEIPFVKIGNQVFFKKGIRKPSEEREIARTEGYESFSEVASYWNPGCICDRRDVKYICDAYSLSAMKRGCEWFLKSIHGTPEGYETIEEVAARWGITPFEARYFCYRYLLPTIKVKGKTLFVKEGIAKPTETVVMLVYEVKKRI